MRKVLYINEKAAELLFENEEFTDAEIGAIIRGVYHFDNYNKLPSFNDRAMNVVCKTICNDLVERRNQYIRHSERLKKHAN